VAQKLISWSSQQQVFGMLKSGKIKNQQLKESVQINIGL
jgi:hypothetical protein